MRKIIVILTCLLLTGTMAIAQNQNRGGARMNAKETADQMTDRMAKTYSLNDEQKKQLLEVNQQMLEDARKRFEAVRGKAGNTTSGERPQITPEQREQMRAEMKASREAYDGKVQKIFTTEQYKAYQKNEQSRQNNRPRR